MDRLPGGFYKWFIDKLAPILTRVFNYTLFKGDPPDSWSEAIISVIHKAGKDLTCCEGYRAISLLCNDQKLLTSISVVYQYLTHYNKINKSRPVWLHPWQRRNQQYKLYITTCAKNNIKNDMLITESVTDTMISLYADNVLTYISDPVNSINFTTINKWLSSFMSQKKRNKFAMFKRIWGGLKS